MTTETPAAVLRAAAALLREAASHATPGPWRSHDTWLDSGGHTATVLTDRPDINDTELVAWLPTMSNTPWDEARNAWRNAGWMALMDPSVGLALADWLDAYGLDWDRCPSDHPGMSLDEHALTVARRILGTTEQADTVAAPTVDLGPADGQQKTRLLAKLHDSLTPIPEQPDTEGSSVLCPRGVLRQRHASHWWHPQPGMSDVRCPGLAATPAPAEETK